VREVNNTLSRNPSGADALRGYATPITLTQGMLDDIAEKSQTAQDPAASFHLIEVAMHKLPEAIASAGGLAALAATTDDKTTDDKTTDDKTAGQVQLAIAQDRLASAVEEVNVILWVGTEHSSSYAATLGILQPLDEFSAAADELGEAVRELGTATPAARDRIDTTSTKLKTAGSALATSVFQTFDAQLASAAAGYTGQRRLLVGIGILMVLAVVALVWLRFPWPEGARREPLEDRTGRHGVSRTAESRAERSKQSPSLVDARELLSREAATAGRVVGARKR
jgi:hypothetical protein